MLTSEIQRACRCAMTAILVLAGCLVGQAMGRTSVIASEEVDADTRRQVDELLLAADAKRNFMAMSLVIMKLLKAADWLDASELELRLRELNANARLIAVPLRDAPAGLTAGFAGSGNALHNAAKVPLYFLWIGVNGPTEADQKLRSAGSLSYSENLKRLKVTGLLTPAANAFSRFVSEPDATNMPESQDARNLYKALSDYVQQGFVNRDAEHLVSRVVNQYLEKQGSDKRFAVNRVPDASLINVYVLATDPGRHFREIDCNCGYVPGTSTIICDDKFLSQFTSLIQLSTDQEDLEIGGMLEIVNLQFSYFLLQWIIGHELGHLILAHDFETAYFEVQPMLKPGSRVPPKALRQFEIAADEFAIKNLEDQQEIFYAWLGLSNVVSRTYGEAIEKQFEKEGVLFKPEDIQPLAAKNKVALLDNRSPHPPFLFRATQLANLVLQSHKDKVLDTTGHFDRILANLTLSPDGVPSRSMCAAQ